MDLEAMTRIVQVKDLAFPVVDYGQGPAVLLLHGFPDSRHLWRYQIPVLVKAGLRVIAPDLRGFGDAPKPSGVEAYQVSIAARDMFAILDTLQVAQASIVGHDW